MPPSLSASKRLHDHAEHFFTCQTSFTKAVFHPLRGGLVLGVGGGCDGASGLCRNVSGELQGSVPGPTKPDPLGIGSGRGLARFPSRQELSCQPRSPAVELHSHWVEVRGPASGHAAPAPAPAPAPASSVFFSSLRHSSTAHPKPDNPAFKGQKTGAHSLNLQCAWTESKKKGGGGEVNPKAVRHCGSAQFDCRYTARNAFHVVARCTIFPCTAVRA